MLSIFSVSISSEKCFFMSFAHFLIGQSFFFSVPLYSSFLLLCWGYFVTFTKFLIVYHSWIHPFHHSPLFRPLIPGTVLTGLIFSIYIHVYPVFVPYSFSYTLSPHPPWLPAVFFYHWILRIPYIFEILVFVYSVVCRCFLSVCSERSGLKSKVFIFIFVYYYFLWSWDLNSESHAY
jgi:hypothetical protein